MVAVQRQRDQPAGQRPARIHGIRDEIEMRFTALAATRPARIVVDMAQVPFLASIGIRLLASNAKALKLRGGRMVIASPQPMVKEVFDIVGMDSIIPVHADLDSACAALR